ncbi:MAG: four helix bundle protein [Elusimicrobia bacterium]|nr:four helix bundle protein [Candidatus Liberimonas magnetica]
MQNNISERLLDFAAQIIKLTSHFYDRVELRIIGKQIIRSATSSGANYEEACSAESRLDFVHKMQIVLKELRETTYCLKLIERTNLVKNLSILTLNKRM